MLIWIFGDVQQNVVTQHTNQTASGSLVLAKANVQWFLSIDADTLPEKVKKAGKRTFRTLTINEEEIEFSEGFTELHTRSYEEILNGKGFLLEENVKAINLVHEIRNYRQTQ